MAAGLSRINLSAGTFWVRLTPFETRENRLRYPSGDFCAE